MIRVLIADDHTMIAKLIKHMLENSKEIEVVAIVGSGDEVLETAEKRKIDVMLLDIDMPALDGIQTMINIGKKHKDIKCIILSHHSEPWVIQKALESGAAGYLTKNAEADEVRDAILTVYKGGKYFCKTTLGMIAKNITKKPGQASADELLAKLSPRERDVLRELAEGLTNQQISEKLFISPRTVEIHRKNIMDKLGAQNIVSLIRIIIESNLIDKV